MDDDGKPVFGARCYLEIIDVTGGNWREFTKVVRTDGSRVHLDFSALPKRGNTTLVAEKPGYGMSFRNIWPPEPAMGLDPSVLSLKRYAKYEGRLVLPSGAPAVGLRVAPVFVQISERRAGGPARVPGKDEYEPVSQVAQSVRFTPEQGAQLAATTDSIGRFTFSNLPPGTTQVEVLDDRFATIYWGNQFVSGQRTTIILRPAASISGRVTRDGAPVSDVRVMAEPVTPYGASFWDARTDKNGRYRIARVPEGSYDVAPHVSIPMSHEVVASPRLDLHVRRGIALNGMDFKLVRGATLEGRVMRPGGQGYKTEVVVSPPGEKERGWGRAIDTDGEGRFQMHVPPGEIQVQLPRELWRSTDHSEVRKRLTVRDGQVVRVEMVDPYATASRRSG